MSSIRVAPLTLNLSLYAGDGVTIALQFTDDESGGTIAMPGEWAAQVRREPQSIDVLTDFAVDTTQHDAGLILLSLTGEQVRAIPSGSVYDVQQTQPDVEPRTWYRGRITVSWDVTRVDAA